jgi:hypothetical protein
MMHMRNAIQALASCGEEGRGHPITNTVSRMYTFHERWVNRHIVLVVLWELRRERAMVLCGFEL